MKFRQLIIITLLTSLASLSYAQNPIVDSLKNVLVSAEGEDRVNTLVELAFNLENINIDSAKAYAHEALYLSEKINYKSGLGESYFELAWIHKTEGQKEKALNLLELAEKQFSEIDAKKRLASVYNIYGVIFQNSSEYQSAYKYYQKSLEKYKEINDKKGEAKTLNNIGTIFYRSGKFTRAVEFYFKAIKINENLNDIRSTGLSYGNLGNLFRQQKDYSNALKYYKKAKKQFEIISNEQKIGMTLDGIGSVYQKINKIDSALINYKEALEYFTKANDKPQIATTLNNIGKLYQETEEYENALQNHQKALDYALSTEDKSRIAEVYTNIGKMQIKLGLYDDSHKNLIKGLGMARDIGEQQRELESYEGLFQYFEAKEQFREAFYNYIKYSQVKDSLYSLEKSREIHRLAKEFETEKKEQENNLLREKEAANLATIQKQRIQAYALLGGILLFLTFSIYYYRVYQQKKATNELLARQNDEINRKQSQIVSINESLKKSQIQLHHANEELQKLNTGLESTVKERTFELQKSNQELDTFLYQSSHALRRPVVSVMGLTQLARMEENGGAVRLYDKIDDTLVRMDLMLKKLVMASEINFTNGKKETIDFHRTITDIWSELSTKLQADRIKLELYIDNDLEYQTDKRLIKIMFQNLLENAIVYSRANMQEVSNIKITISHDSSYLNIIVHDNGIGIPEEVISNIFNMFTVGTDKTKGYGLGLYLVKKVIERLNGDIFVNSRKEEFTTFNIRLPFFPSN
ncbi:tetratricopeptide repeat-containing sensor histidine kinase [Fulvivirgaceae bacterium BMA10]|uniref:histidine kinase n=1 Tax=Splendidivirga corallicola TaxID=3051826 RepID=A0ABT8L154_9BACT|nr:tetratricopeptide repeat-containing sensor histidine kinase [Fulvivirgaceae bacterium BMA10]